MNKEEIKKDVAKYAVDFVQNKMIIGLGSGSTMGYFIEGLVERKKRGLEIKAVASSDLSWNLAESGGIEVIDINDAPRIDLMVDGADEIDPQKRMIKGGGAALLKEKILATSSDKRIIIVDETKVVTKLGHFPLAVEIVIYGAAATKGKIDSLGHKSKFRMLNEKDFFITENGNLILDVFFTSLRDYPEKDHIAILDIPGVIETGFFFGLADKVIVGKRKGIIEEI
jgi:ribose 5-phosphate isomerase A